MTYVNAAEVPNPPQPQLKLKENKMKVQELWPSKYVKAADLNGNPVTVTIRLVKMEEVTNNEQKVLKPVVYFHEAQKGLILNKTNGIIIAGLYGQDTDGWVGKRITLYPKQIPYFGEMQNCIRVRIELPDAPVF